MKDNNKTGVTLEELDQIRRDAEYDGMNGYGRQLPSKHMKISEMLEPMTYYLETKPNYELKDVVYNESYDKAKQRRDDLQNNSK